MIVGRAAASRVDRREFLWGDGAAPDLFELGSDEDLVGFVNVPLTTAPCYLHFQPLPCQEGEAPRCLGISGFDHDPRQRAAVEGVVWTAYYRLHGRTMGGKKWKDFHWQLNVGPNGVKLEESDSLGVGVTVGLMSVQWNLPVPQNMLFSGELGKAESALKEMGGGGEKMAVADCALNFVKVLNPNDLAGDKHRRVRTVEDLVKEVWVKSGKKKQEEVELGRAPGYYRRVIHFGALRDNLEPEDGGVFKGLCFGAAVTVVKAPNKDMTPVLTGFDAQEMEIKSDAVNTLRAAFIKAATPEFCKFFGASSPEELTLHVQVDPHAVWNTACT